MGSRRERRRSGDRLRPPTRLRAGSGCPVSPPRCCWPSPSPSGSARDIAALDLPHYRQLVETAFPKARVSVIDTPRTFFTAPEGTYDALLFSAEGGSAWTLVYPQFSVVVPRPSRVAAPVGFALPQDARELATFVDTWVRLKKKDGTLDRLYANWILGQGAKPHEPRWSVIRNVLGWVD